MENKNKRKLERRKAEIKSAIQFSIYQKEKLIRFVQDLNTQYTNKTITEEQYYKQLNQTLENKPLEKWINYYNECIQYYKQDLNICNKELRKETRTKAPLLITLAIFMILGLGIFFLKPEITGFAILEDSITFDRIIDCHKCGQHKAPPMTDVNMTIVANFTGTTENDLLIDYFNKEWTIVDAGGGFIEPYNETYRQISWVVNNDNNIVSRSYTIRSPALTTPPTNYYFQSELVNVKSNLWGIKVSDPVKSLNTVTLNIPDSDPDINEAGTFAMNCTWTETGTGGPEEGAIYYEYSNDGGATNVTIPSSGSELTTADTNPLTGTVDATMYKITVTGAGAGNYQVSCRVYGTNLADSRWSGDQTVTVNAGANNDYPVFDNASVNATYLMDEQFARFNVTVVDASDTITFVNGTINGSVYNFTDAGVNNEWYYQWECNTTQQTGVINFTVANANDSGSPVNWNSTTITGVGVNCDPNAPLITVAEINATSPVTLNTIVKVNASIVDAESNLNTTILEIIPPISSAFNVTPTQDGNESYNDTVILSEAGQWKFRFYANDTAKNNATPVVADDKASNAYIEVNEAPIINNITLSGNQVIKEGGARYISFTFNVTDTDGADTLDNSTATGTFNKTGEANRTNSSCHQVYSQGNVAMYNCSVGVWYFDANGNWSINGSIKDSSGSYAQNYSLPFTLSLTTGMVMGPTSIEWPTTISVLSTNVGADNDPIEVNNTGNKAISVNYINITAYDLQGEDNQSHYILASAFTVDWEDASDGSVMTNATSQNVTIANITVGNFSTDDGKTGQEFLYFYLEDVNDSLTQQSYSTVASTIPAWTVAVS